MAKPDGADTPGEQEWPLLSLLRESGDDLEATSPAFDIAASAARLNGAASAQGLLSSGNPLDMAQTATGASLEEEARFDLEAGISQLKDAAHARGLLSSSASEAFDAEAFLALVSRKEVLSYSSTQTQSGTREKFPDAQSRPDFQHELLAIREDPEVRSLALRRAKNPEIAEEALQTAYLAVSRIPNPDPIENLRTYFCAVLLREIYRELGQRRLEAPVDFTASDDVRQGRPVINSPAPRPLSEEVQTRLLGQGWLGAFRARPELAAKVPSRSPDPARYQRLIVKVAENMLRVILKENADIDPDINEALRGGYAEWFAAPTSSMNIRHQRLLRARSDVSALLRTIVERRDLTS